MKLVLPRQHQHWSVDFELLSTHRGLCNSWIEIKRFSHNRLISDSRQTTVCFTNTYSLVHQCKTWSVINRFDLLSPQNCRANQGINCLTEGYGVWKQVSLTSWQLQPTTNPSVHHKDPTTLYSADKCNMETFCDCLQSLSMYPTMVTHRRSKPPPTQMTPLSRQTPSSSSSSSYLVGTRLRHLPARFTRIPPLKVIAIASIDDTHERHPVSFCLYLFGECSTWWYILDSLAKQKKKRLPARSTPLFGTTELDQGEANVCIWQDTRQSKRGAL